MSSTMKEKTRDESYWPVLVLDGSAASWYRTTTLVKRDQDAKPHAAATNSLRWHPGYGAHAEQPAWHDPAAV